MKIEESQLFSVMIFAEFFWFVAAYSNILAVKSYKRVFGREIINKSKILEKGG